MSRQFYITTFILLIVIGLTSFMTIRLGLFPVAIVNSHPVSEARFERAMEEIIAGFVDDPKPLGDSELKRSALQKIIENELVYREAQKYFGSGLPTYQKSETIRALLRGQFTALGTSLEEWLAISKNNASVYVLVSGFVWSGNKIVFED